MANLFRLQRILAIIFALSVPAAFAAVYLDGKQIDADVIIKTKGTTPEPPPVEPTEPPVQPPVEPPSDCPTAGRVPLTHPRLDLRTPSAQVEVSTVGVTAGVVVGSSATWHIAYGMRPGSAGAYKYAAITTCPIFDNKYVVGACLGSGSSTIAVKSGTNCKLEAGKKYYLLYGAPHCTASTCRAVRNLYISQ